MLKGDINMITQKGLVHIYTGDGKGKTTTAFGLAMRCAGNRKRVYIVQFLKSTPTGEVKLIESMQNPDLQVFRFESPHGFFPHMDMTQKEVLNSEIKNALDFIEKCLRDNECDMLVLDEILGAAENGLIDMQQIQGIISLKPETMELVLTGRNAPPELVCAADYVTELKHIKHPYEQGILARCGIEY